VLYNPNWPMDAAQKLGVDKQFASVPPPQAYWLSKRATRSRRRAVTFQPASARAVSSGCSGAGGAKRAGGHCDAVLPALQELTRLQDASNT